MNERQKAHPLLLTLVKIQRKYNKDYSWPSQNKIIELMDIRQGVRKSRATINRWLRIITDNKYLIRRRRIKRHPQYGIVFKSTLYKITIKGYRMLQAFGVDMSKEIDAYQRWLEEVHPERKTKKVHQVLSEAKHNPKHQEYIKKILDRLTENLVA